MDPVDAPARESDFLGVVRVDRGGEQLLEAGAAGPPLTRDPRQAPS